MIQYTRDDLYTHFDELGMRPGDDILVHCAMFAFGNFEGGVGGVYEALTQYLGASSTIAVPTFTLWMESDDTYCFDTPSQRMGQLAEHVRLQDSAIRSRCPMHNHAAVGPKAKMLQSFSGKYSTGKGSDFELFYDEGFKNIFLGCSPKDSGTFLIHSEAMARVPYREWITLSRKVQWKEEPLCNFELSYFARKAKLENFESCEVDDIGIKIDLGVLQDLLVSKSVLKEVALPYGRSFSGSIRNIQNTVIEAFIQDPLLTLKSDRCA